MTGYSNVAGGSLQLAQKGFQIDESHGFISQSVIKFENRIQIILQANPDSKRCISSTASNLTLVRFHWSTKRNGGTQTLFPRILKSLNTPISTRTSESWSKMSQKIENISSDFLAHFRLGFWCLSWNWNIHFFRILGKKVWTQAMRALSQSLWLTKWKPFQDQNGCDIAKQCTEYIYSSDLFNETVVTQVGDRSSPFWPRFLIDPIYIIWPNTGPVLQGVVWNAPKSMWRRIWSCYDICIFNAPKSWVLNFKIEHMLFILNAAFQMPHFQYSRNIWNVPFSHFQNQIEKMEQFKYFEHKKSAISDSNASHHVT